MKKLYFAFIVFMMFSLQACGFEIVDTGHRGIETKYGEVVGNPLPEGLHFYNPVTSNITEMNIQTQKYSAETTPFTKDVQAAKIVYTLNYNLEAAASGTVFKDVGRDYAQVLIPQDVEGAIKSVFGQWEAVEIISNREKVRSGIQELLTRNLAAKNIVVTDFEINNIDYNDSFEASVEAKVIAVQKADEAKNHTIRIKEEALQKVVAATAEAESMRIRSDSLKTNKALIEYEAVMRWDGKLPVTMLGGSGVVPFVNVGK